jgi:glycosyltransferase involved in cell wall biosynthesis
MQRVLTITGHYLPGYKAGGPIRTIANLVEWLGDEFEFRILTADRDLDDQQAFASITPGRWQPIGKAQVRYLSPSEQTWWQWRRWLHDIDYDILYLNGFFNPYTRAALGLRQLKAAPVKPIILAPRGEFSAGALGLKRHKKRAFLGWAKLSGLCENLTWQATNSAEADAIRAIFGSSVMRVVVASNLPTPIAHGLADLPFRPKAAGSARVAFLARIARMKNLDFALRALSAVVGDVEFNIYGPIEDREHWGQCLSLIGQLPANVSASYQGEVHPSQVQDIFGSHHLLFLPTRGENFGHAILEALQAGCPVLTSDQTPWRNLSDKMAGWDLPLAEPTRFTDTLNAVVAMDATDYQRWMQGALRFADEFVSNSDLLQTNRALFQQSAAMLSTSAGRARS